MHGPINVKSPNTTSKWQMGFNSAFKGLRVKLAGTRKGKVHPIIGHEGPEGEQRYSSTLSLTSEIDGGEGSTPRPGHFTPGKENRRRLGEPQGRPGQVRKISRPPAFDPRTVQPVASRHTDYVIPTHSTQKRMRNAYKV
jgi:hypothetical protein